MIMMYSESDSPIYIASVLGARLKSIRLNRDMTQEEVASKAWVSRRTVLNAEKGSVKLSDLIAILSALNMLNNFNVLIPEVPLSPIQLLKLQGKARKRASGNNKRTQKLEIQTAKPDLDW